MGDFASRIKEIREQRGLTQRELASMLGYSDRSSICKIENGDRSVPAEKALEIAKILAVDLEWLLGEEYYSKQDNHLSVDSPLTLEQTIFERLNPAGQKKALKYLKKLIDNQNYRKSE